MLLTNFLPQTQSFASCFHSIHYHSCPVHACMRMYMPRPHCDFWQCYINWKVVQWLCQNPVLLLLFFSISHLWCVHCIDGMSIVHHIIIPSVILTDISATSTANIPALQLITVHTLQLSPAFQLRLRFWSLSPFTVPLTFQQLSLLLNKLCLSFTSTDSSTTFTLSHATAQRA